MYQFLDLAGELLCLENAKWAEGFSFVAGIDEAGRGPLAGPVVAAAVILPRDVPIPRVNDSKQLTAPQREELADALKNLPGIDYALGIVDAAEIDRINILKATHKAMRIAAEGLEKLDFILVDGLPVKTLPCPSQAVVKGDAKSASIAAASILAKVTRDSMMEEYARLYPGYGFEEHKGYGTAKHIRALTELGPCPIHRRSFAPLREMLSPKEQMELF